MTKIKLETSASFRAISKIFFLIKLNLTPLYGSPSHTTVINWVHKIGYYELTKKKEKADDWDHHPGPQYSTW